MSKATIPQSVRQQVQQDGRYRCGYCLTPQHIIGRPMTIDHIQPEIKGGETVRENLWLACRRCNEFKGSRTQAVDPVTNETVPLFNPRTQSWNVHFAWNQDGIRVIGLTAVDRATVITLHLNNDEIVASRSLWVQAGWHPPAD